MSLLVHIVFVSQVVFGSAKPVFPVEGVNVRSQELSQHNLGQNGSVLIFLSAKCPCSHSHLDELKSLAATYPQLSFLGVNSNPDEGEELVQKYFDKAQLPFPVIRDKNLELANRLKALKTPHAFVLGVKGEVLYQGGVSSSHDATRADRQYLRDALEDISKGRKVRTPEGRTLGCVISRGIKNVW